MTNKTYYKTSITIEVLSEEPIPGDKDIQDIAWECKEGNYVLKNTKEYVETKLNGKQAADELYEAGSEPGFFQLDDDGNDCFQF